MTIIAKSRLVLTCASIRAGFCAQKCKCECDGKTIAEKLSAKVGKRKRKSTDTRRTEREAAKQARTKTVVCVNTFRQKPNEEEPKTLRTVRELWDAYNLPGSTLKNVPSRTVREEDADLKVNNPSRFSTLFSASFKL